MEIRDAIPLLRAIVVREQKNGCPMAGEYLIEPALRRWRSYERRNKRNKNKSLEHRVLDLKKGLMTLFPNHTYDEACLAHLAQSFVEALHQERADGGSDSSPQPGSCADKTR